MISVTRNFRVVIQGSPAYNWQVTSTSGTPVLSAGRSTEEVLSLTINYLPTATFPDTLTVTCTGDNGCVATFTQSVANPCSSITGSISATDDLQFAFSNTGYIYEWIYDTSIFNAVGADSRILNLSLKTSDVPATTLVTVVVSDEKGCSATFNRTYTFCRPTLQVAKGAVICVEQVPQVTLTLTNTGCTNTLSSNYSITTPQGWEVNGTTIRKVAGPDSGNIQVYSITTQGLQSNRVVVPVNFAGVCTPATTTFPGVNLPKDNSVVKVPVNGTKVNIPIEVESGNPDLSGPVFIPTGTQSLTGGTLASPNFQAEFVPGNEVEVTYLTNTPFLDRIRYGVPSVQGKISNVHNLYLDGFDYPASTGTNQSLTANTTTLNTYSIANFFNPFVDLIEITTAPTKGAATIINGNLEYTPLPTATGTDTLTLKGLTADGKQGTITVTFNLVNPGVTQNINVCANPANLTSYQGTPGGTWAQLSGPSVTGLPAATVFPSPGAYLFSYTVGTAVMNLGVQYSTKTVSGTISTGIVGTQINWIIGQTGLTNNNEIGFKIYRSTGTPLIPNDYYEVVPANSFTSTSVTLNYIGTGGYNYTIVAEVTDACGVVDTQSSSTYVIP
jgi:hypothetical protein